jgi:hypothetical protein
MDLNDSVLLSFRLDSAQKMVLQSKQLTPDPTWELIRAMLCWWVKKKSRRKLLL